MANPQGGEERNDDDADVLNDEWLEQNWMDLIQDYPRQWIAVMDQKVICSASTRSGANSAAKEIAKGKPFSLYFIEPTPLPL